MKKNLVLKNGHLKAAYSLCGSNSWVQMKMLKEFLCSLSGEVGRAEKSHLKRLSVFLKPQLLCTPYKSYQKITYQLGTGIASLPVPVPCPLLALRLLGSSCRKLLLRASWDFSFLPPAADFIWLDPRWWKVICCIHCSFWLVLICYWRSYQYFCIPNL